MLRITEYIKAQDKVISKYVKRALKLDSQEELARCFKELFIEATLLGVSSSETDIEHMSKRHFSERSSRRFRIELSDVKKTKSITDRASKFWDEYSFKLAGDFKESQLRAAEKIFKKRIAQGGYTQKELKELISKELKIKNEVRLDMIVTTEMNKCFNYGRVENAREHKKNGGIVRALKFHAVMDLHTSYTCNVRNGLVLDLDDPRIDENTPPLHPRCRSMWLYVDKWDYEKDYNNQSSKEWDTHYLVQSKPDETWGNPFAYGGRKEPDYIKFQDKKEAYDWFRNNKVTVNKIGEFTKNDLEILEELGNIKERSIEFPHTIRIEEELFNKYGVLDVAPASYMNDTLYINSKFNLKNLEKMAGYNFKEGHWSTKNKNHIINHELGHYLHEKSDKKLYNDLIKYKFSNEELAIVSKVSNYAKENPREFVAEVYAKLLIKDYDIDMEVITLFNKFGGEMP